MDLLEGLHGEFGDAVAVRAAVASDAVDSVAPQVVAAPRDEAAALGLVAWCGRERQAFVVRGGGTALHVGARPERCDLIVSTECLGGVVEHDEGNATVTAQAGIALPVLNEFVGSQRQFVPLDGTAVSSRATLGGVIATNHSGMTRLKYGTPRDLVVGLHAVLSDGRLIKAGSKVVKNVSGYDLNKIFIGSCGSLGLITEVTLRLLPNVAAAANWYGRYDSLGDALEQAELIHSGPFEPTALRITAQRSGVSLFAQFDGGEKAVEAQLGKLPASTGTEVLESAQTVFQLRASLPVHDASAFVVALERTGPTVLSWDYGSGVVRAAYAELPDDAASQVTALRRAATTRQGCLIVERAPVELKTPEFVWGPRRADFALMEKLKRVYDPAGVCAPGRFVGGL